jgi:hypothetical protein
MDTAGDGFFATFDGPARAIRCACAIRDSLRELGLEIRAGLHTGECELLDNKTGGIAVHIGARVASHAAPNDFLVSSTVKDLVAGSGIGFDDRGPHELKGTRANGDSTRSPKRAESTLSKPRSRTIAAPPPNRHGRSYDDPTSVLRRQPSRLRQCFHGTLIERELEDRVGRG